MIGRERGSDSVGDGCVREGEVRERGVRERVRKREECEKERGRYREKIGVAWWCDLIMYTSNKESKNNNSSNSYVFGCRQKY